MLNLMTQVGDFNMENLSPVQSANLAKGVYTLVDAPSLEAGILLMSAALKNIIEVGMSREKGACKSSLRCLGCLD